MCAIRNSSLNSEACTDHDDVRVWFFIYLQQKIKQTNFGKQIWKIKEKNIWTRTFYRHCCLEFGGEKKVSLVVMK